MTRDSRPARVAIVGGGCASLAAAYELTRPEHRGAYEVTVYQMGWRLGGKGASGRGDEGRIEEHGLHLWMGFYENAFRLMRECYGELEARRRRDRCPIVTWQDAFEPAPLVAVTDRAPNGDWEAWIARFPPGEGLPGDPLERRNPFSVSGYLQQAAILLIELLRSAEGAAPPPRPAQGAPMGADAAVRAVDALLGYGALATAAALFEAADLLRASCEALFPRAYRGDDEVLLRLVDAIALEAKSRLDRLVSGDGRLRRVWQVIDLILAIMRGALRFGLAADPRGFGAIDDYDWREWLSLSGASEASLDSGFVRGIYDLAFAFQGGDPGRQRLAAGVALRGAMRMFFTYRGSLFWRMRAGMGDIVFTPLYEVLRARGVRFEFFHKLRRVKLGPESPGEAPHVAELVFDVQARVRGGAEYRPLVDVRGLPCWPSKPLYDQLVSGAGLEREGRAFEAAWETRREGEKALRVARDFDFVVLGVSIGAIPHVAPELVARSPRWRAMIENVETVATQAFQVWMREDMQKLGWEHGPVDLSGYVEPFDTWADMSHLVPAEGWAQPVRSIAYFCSVLPDEGPPGEVDRALQERRKDEVRRNAVRFLDHDVTALWPGAADAKGRFRWEVLVAPGEDGTPRGRKVKGEARFGTQFWTANVGPTDRYVLSLPGTIRHRISPLDMTFDNLTIAGDWTESGLNTGCVESAVMSGLLAAHALSHSPPLEDIIGYDHP